MVSRYLFTVWPFTGHIHPNLALARALRRTGHGVAFYTGTNARSLVAAEGCQYFALFLARIRREACALRRARVGASRR